MLANWSLILNVLLLIGVIIAIGRLMKARRQNLNYERYKPTSGKSEYSVYDKKLAHDDIIAVRKVNKEVLLTTQPEEVNEAPPKSAKTPPVLMSQVPEAATEPMPIMQEQPIDKVPESSSEKKAIPSTVMLFLLAKDNRHFAGYELLQTLLTCGLRFGEGNLFHRHQLPNGQGPISCSLAAATATGVFDLQNMGAFSARGLCLFMHTSQDARLNTERLSIMLDTAQQLSEMLNAHLLDEQRKPLTTERVADYYKMLHIE